MQFLKIVVVVFFISQSGCRQPVERPNIILIVTDDLDRRSVDLMPNLQALVAGPGATFTNYFANVALCCPARASILRGQYAQNHQVKTNRAPLGGFEKFRELGHENSTIATWLQTAGYRTALFGKYLNDYPGDSPTHIPKGWDEWYGLIQERTRHYFNYDMNANGKIVSYGDEPEDYETDVLSRQAADFIRRNRTQPFFIYLATSAPHSPSVPAPRHGKEFQGFKAPSPPSFNEADLSDKPEWVRNKTGLSDTEIAQLDKGYRRRLQSLRAVDEMIENLIATLEVEEQLENTYLFFVSDNGFHRGEHRIVSGKNTPYDESTNVPLLVRGPGVSSGQKIEHLVQDVDLAPTFAELAGATAGDFVDGRSFGPLLKNNPPPANAWRQAALITHGWRQGLFFEHGIEHNSKNDRQDTPAFQALRTKDYLYVEYTTTDECELYDVHKDPYQLQNLYATTDSVLIAQLAKQLAILSKCAGADCFITTMENGYGKN